MNIKDAWENYYSHTGSASERTRQLAFAGIALIWIFKRDDTHIRQELTFPAMLIAIALTVDLAQYVVASEAWRRFVRSQEKERDRIEATGAQYEDYFHAPDNINSWAVGCWWVKIACVLLAYLFLIWFLVNTIVA